MPCKGSLQDKEYCASKMMDEIVAQAKAAIPVLISQLTDTPRNKEADLRHCLLHAE
jgi:hypothetical protein